MFSFFEHVAKEQSDLKLQLQLTPDQYVGQLLPMSLIVQVTI